MLQRFQIFLRSLRSRFRLRTVALVSGIFLLLLAGAVAALPTLLSTRAVQVRLERALSAAMHRSISWSDLRLSWGEGIRLTGLELGPAPPPLLTASVGELLLDPGFGGGEGKALGLVLRLRVAGVRAELSPAPPGAPPVPPSPPPSGKDPLTALAEAVQGIEARDWPLPIDLRLQAEVESVRLAYRDPATQRILALNDLFLHLAAPSLASQPVSLDCGARVELDGREVGPVRLATRISRLVTPAGRLHPAAAEVALELSAPGTDLSVQGSLVSSAGLATRLRLDLAPLTSAVAPLLPPSLPHLAGVVTIRCDAAFDAVRDLHAAVEVDGEKLAASGVALGRETAGPFEVHLRQRIATDRLRQQVSFPAGELTVPPLLTAAWQASVERPTARDRKVNARFGPLRLDLARTLAAVAPFLPATAPRLSLDGELFLQELAVRLHGSDNHGEVTLAGCGIDLRSLRLPLDRGAMTAQALRLRVEKAALPLLAARPEAVSADLSWSIASLDLSGPRAVALRDGKGGIRLQVEDLDLDAPSSLRVAARVSGQQSLAIARLDVSPLLQVAGVQEELQMTARLHPDGTVDFAFPLLKAGVAAAQVTAGGKSLAPFPVQLEATVAGGVIPLPGRGRPGMEQATCLLSLGEALHLQAVAALPPTLPQRFTSSGDLALDLNQLTALAAPFLPAGSEAGGRLDANWEVAAPFPLAPLPAENNPLRQARAGAALLERLNVALHLEEVALSLPLAQGRLTAFLATPQPLRLALESGGERLNLGGRLAFHGVSGLPGVAAAFSPQKGELALDGVLKDWKSFFLSEELHVSPLGLAQSAELSVDRIDALFAEKEVNAAVALKRLDATFFGHVDATFPPELTPLLPGVELAGGAAVGARLDLEGGKELRVRAYAATRDLDVRLAGKTEVNGIRSDLLVERSFALGSPPSGATWLPLSTALVQPPPPLPPAGTADLLGRIRSDLRETVDAPRGVTIRRITAQAGPLPMEFTAIEGDLLAGPERVGLNFFQAELLGGTIRARGVIDLHDEVPQVTAACSFSHLDANRLLPPEILRSVAAGGEEAEVTGEFALDLPLATESRALLEGVRLQLKLRKVGSRTLERGLYSLDPYERNEQVVAQRKLLRYGQLKYFQLQAVDGALSISGEVSAAGLPLRLPRVERLRLAELPLRRETEQAVKAIAAARPLLDLVRADTLQVDANGTLSLLRRNHDVVRP